MYAEWTVVRAYDGAMDVHWWGGTAVRINHANGMQERVAMIRLPSFGMGYCIHADELRWGQRTLIYRGHSGFSLGWYFKPEAYGQAQ